MAKFLNAEGVKTFWNKIKEDFVPKDEIVQLKQNIEEVELQAEITNEVACGIHPQNIAVRIKDTYYTTLLEAWEAATSGDTIFLLKDQTITHNNLILNDGRNLSLDLGGCYLNMSNCYIEVIDGELAIKHGTLQNQLGQYAIKAVASPNDNKKAVIDLKPDLTILALNSYGVIISPNGTNVTGGQYNVTLTCDCRIRSRYPCLYVNGNILQQTNSAQKCYLNIGANADLRCYEMKEPACPAIFIAGYVSCNIAGGCSIVGGSGLEARAGDITIDGGEFKAVAPELKVIANSSGSTTAGAAIAIAQHTTEQKIDVIVNDGYFEAPVPFVESNPQGNSNIYDTVSLNIHGGTFVSTQNKKPIQTDQASIQIDGGIFYPVEKSES